MYLYFSTLVWPSGTSSLAAFKELVKDKLLKPSPSVTVKVKIVPFSTSDFPTSNCKQCKDLLTESGLLQSIKTVRWRLLQTSMYNLTTEVCQSLCILHVYL